MSTESTIKEPTDVQSIEKRIAELVPACDFKGVKFCDISPLLANPVMLGMACHLLAAHFAPGNYVDAVVGLEARGFLFGPAIAMDIGVKFVQLRKPGKLPGATLAQSYDKEYGTDTIEMQVGAIQPGERVLLVDDILATGGTLLAACKLIQAAGGTPVGCALIAELEHLGGRKLLEAQVGVVDIKTLAHIKFE